MSLLSCTAQMLGSSHDRHCTPCVPSHAPTRLLVLAAAVRACPCTPQGTPKFHQGRCPPREHMQCKHWTGAPVCRTRPQRCRPSCCWCSRCRTAPCPARASLSAGLLKGRHRPRCTPCRSIALARRACLHPGAYYLAPATCRGPAACNGGAGAAGGAWALEVHRLSGPATCCRGPRSAYGRTWQRGKCSDAGTLGWGSRSLGGPSGSGLGHGSTQGLLGHASLGWGGAQGMHTQQALDG